MATDNEQAGQDSPADAAAALAGRLRHDMVGALELFTVYLGERLGLYAEQAGFASVEVLPLKPKPCGSTS